MKSARDFVMRDRAELARRYGAFYARRVTLDEQRVPAALRGLTPYAEIWAVPDDPERDGLVERSPEVARQDLRELMEAHDDAFDDWLAGPEADARPPSREYVAFSNLRIAWDYLDALGVPDDEKE